MAYVVYIQHLNGYYSFMKQLAIELDQIDRSVLTHLQRDARLTNKELAQRVSLSPPGLVKRLRRLEQAGVLRQYTALVDREAVGLDLLCFVHVTLGHHQVEAVRRFRDAIVELGEVLECHHVTGEFDYLLKVLVPNHQALEAFLVEKLTPLPGVDRIRTSVVLREVKSTTTVPVDAQPS